MYHYGNHAAAYPVGIFSPQGHGQSVAKYGKFVYDTCFGFNVAKSSYNVFENAPDSMLAFEIGGDCHVRRISLETKIGEKDTGFAVACRDEDMAQQKTEGNPAIVQNVFSVCTVSGNGEAVVLDNSPNTNVLYRKTKMPAVKYFIQKGEANIVTRVDARRI